MEDFYQYTVEELVLNEAFRNRVLRPTPIEVLEFQQWIESNPLESQKLIAASDVIRAVRITNSPLLADDQSKAVQEIFERTTRKKYEYKSRSLYYWKFAAAAVLAIMIGFYIFPLGKHNVIGSLSSEAQKKAGWEWNNGRYSKLIQLADGSSIFLKPGSAIRYPEHFAADSRKVELQGEAFFEISSDKSKPFFVYSNETVTKVLGTSFSVRTFDKEDATVVGVWSGKVNVSRKNVSGATESVQIIPGQQATINRLKEGIAKSALESDSKISQFLLVAANGKDIEVVHYLQTVRKAFGIEIEFDPKTLSRCKIQANFEGIHLMEQIDAMCKAINAIYAVKNGKIIITSSGC